MSPSLSLDLLLFIFLPPSFFDSSQSFFLASFLTLPSYPFTLPFPFLFDFKEPGLFFRLFAQELGRNLGSLFLLSRSFLSSFTLLLSKLFLS
jgi:hypothetical protein